MSDSHKSVNRRAFLKYGSAASAFGLAGCLGDGGDGDGSDGSDGSGGSGGDGGTGGTTTGDDTPVLRWGSASGGELVTVSGFFAEDAFRSGVGADVMPNVDKYEVQRTATAGSSPVVSGMGAGELDGGAIAFTSAANAIYQEVIPSGISITMPQVWFGPDLPFNMPYVAMDDSGIDSLEDVEGTQFAVNAFGGSADIVARVGLQEAGIDPESDVNMVEIGFGAMSSALREGRVDVGTYVQPLWEDIAEESHVVYDQGDVLGSYLSLFGAFRNEFVEENPDVVRWFVEDHWEGIKWMTDESQKDSVVSTVSDVLDLPEDMLENSIPGASRGPYSGQDGYRMAGEYIQPGVDAMHETGYIPEAVDMDPHVTNEYLPDAADQFPPIVDDGN